MGLVVVASFEDPYEGELAANMLRAAGIEPFFTHDGLAVANPMLRQAVGGFPLRVLDAEAPEARKLLREAAHAFAGRRTQGTVAEADKEDDDDGPARRRRTRLLFVWLYLGLSVGAVLLLLMISKLLPDSAVTVTPPAARDNRLEPLSLPSPFKRGEEGG